MDDQRRRKLEMRLVHMDAAEIQRCMTDPELRAMIDDDVMNSSADSSLEGNTGAFFSMIGVGDLVQQGIEDLVGSSVSMALARS